MKKLTFALLALLAAPIITAQQGTRPRASEKPYAMMDKLAVLEGNWTMVTEITEDGGQTWQAMPASTVTLTRRHKGMILAEIPTDITKPGFHMETYIAYDQYRNQYRKAAIDDVWGIMDIYEGKPDGDVIIFNNLKSGTTFPIENGVWRHFRLTMEIKSPRRVLYVEKSDNDGESWEPAFRSTYTKT